MTRLMTGLAAAALAMCSFSASAESIAPGNVVFEDGAVAQSLTGAPGDPAKGRVVFGNRGMGNCIACHKISTLTEYQWPGEVGPELDGAGDRWSEAQLRGIVANAKMMFDGTMMPSFYKVDGFIRPGDEFTGKAAKTIEPLLTAEQIEDVVAYLATLKE